MPNIHDSTYAQLSAHYNTVLNPTRTDCTNDESTPIECVEEILDRIPAELWSRDDLTILDPCCGYGNYGLVARNKLYQFDDKRILESILHFNDTNSTRLNTVQDIFRGDLYKLNTTCQDFLSTFYTDKFDLIMANPPYAIFDTNGKRVAKNHNHIGLFLDKSLNLLKPDGYLAFLTPDNWMSCAIRNTIVSKLSGLQIIHLDIHTAKRHFPKVGSTFAWYIVQNKPCREPTVVEGIWRGCTYSGLVKFNTRSYIPLLCTQTALDILHKTIDSGLPSFGIQTSSFLHKTTKQELISNEWSALYPHRLLHTQCKTVYSDIPHKYQEGYKVFISLTSKYTVLVDTCGMTQSIAFILCQDRMQAELYCTILQHSLYRFLNNICRWGNFNNTRILARFPFCECLDVYRVFGITMEEQAFMESILG